MVFPRQTSADFASFDVKNKPLETMDRFTFCVWLKTNHTGDMALFSYATADAIEEVVFRLRTGGTYELVIHRQKRWPFNIEKCVNLFIEKAIRKSHSHQHWSDYNRFYRY